MFETSECRLVLEVRIVHGSGEDTEGTVVGDRKGRKDTTALDEHTGGANARQAGEPTQPHPPRATNPTPTFTDVKLMEGNLREHFCTRGS